MARDGLASGLLLRSLGIVHVRRNATQATQATCSYTFICMVYTTDRIRSSVHGEAKQTPRLCSTLDEAFYFGFLMSFDVF